jgi:hypothetical protein
VLLVRLAPWPRSRLHLSELKYRQTYERPVVCLSFLRPTFSVNLPKPLKTASQTSVSLRSFLSGSRDSFQETNIAPT